MHTHYHKEGERQLREGHQRSTCSSPEMVLVVCPPRSPSFSQGLEMFPGHNPTAFWGKASKHISCFFSEHLLHTTHLPMFPCGGETMTQLTWSGCPSGEQKPQHCTAHTSTGPLTHCCLLFSSALSCVPLFLCHITWF